MSKALGAYFSAEMLSCMSGFFNFRFFIKKFFPGAFLGAWLFGVSGRKSHSSAEH